MVIIWTSSSDDSLLVHKITTSVVRMIDQSQVSVTFANCD